MSKATKIWLITATSLVLIGCLIFGSVVIMIKGDFSKMATVGYETSEYDISESYKNISIITTTADVEFVPSENDKTSIVCREQEKLKHSVLVKEETLVIEVNDIRKWYDRIGVVFGAPKITVYIPKGEYGALSVDSNTSDVEIPNDFTFESIDISTKTGSVENHASSLGMIKIKCTTGAIFMENVSADSIDLSVSTGKIRASNIECDGDINIVVTTGNTQLNNLKCENLYSKGSTGDIKLNDVISAKMLSVTRTTGDIKLDSCDGSEIFLQTSTGDISGSLLSEKVFITKTDTGDINVPKTTSGGKCEINTDTGDIKIKIK